MKQYIHSPSFLSIGLLWKALSDRRKKQLFILQLVCILAAISEVVNLGALLPVLRLLATPDKAGQALVSFLPFLRGLNYNLMIIVAALGLSLTVVATTFLRVFALRLQLRLSAVIASDISERVLGSVLAKSYSWHTKTNSSVILGYLFHDVDSIFSAIQAWLVIATNSTIIIFLITALLLLSPSLLLVASILLVSFYSLVFRFSRGSLRMDGQRESDYYQKSLQIVQESLGGIRDVILDKTQNYFLESFSYYNRLRRLSGAAINTKAQVPRYLVEGFTIILLVGLALTLSLTGRSIQESLPLLGTFSLGLYRLLQPLQQSFGSLSTISANQYTLVKLRSFIEQRVDDDQEDYSGSVSLMGSGNQSYPLVYLKDVSFSYSDNTNILTGISLSIEDGERIAFVGKTGSGKSTLSDIILGLIKPSKGCLLLNGHDVFRFPHLYKLWHHDVAHVPQHIYLTDSGFSTNIAFGVPQSEIDMQRVIQAAQQAQIADLIESTPYGYDTVVGDRGIRLSGGQIQRIGIARALYKNARLLVLDEATSALDVKTESEVMEAIIGLDRSITVLLIAHRLSTVRHCDRIVYLEKGSIKAVGTFEELYSTNASFRDFVRQRGSAGSIMSLHE